MATVKQYELITASIIKALKAGRIPWQKPWTGVDGKHRNALTDRGYNGLNPFNWADQSSKARMRPTVKAQRPFTSGSLIRSRSKKRTAPRNLRRFHSYASRSCSIWSRLRT